MQTDPPASEPHNRRRLGKVARLPKDVRDDINYRIANGETYPQIIRALGPAAPDLNEDNLSNWKLGGHQDWLRQQQHLDQLHSRHEMALNILQESSGSTVHDAGRQVVSSHLCELMMEFDPISFLEQLREKPEVYARLVTGLARLSEAELSCARHRAQEQLLKSRLATEQAAQQQAPASKAIRPETLTNVRDQLNLR